MARHKHADLIIAWANGEVVQYRRDHTRPWEDLDVDSQPFCFDVFDYRVKPREVVEYSCVLNYQEPGKSFFNCKEDAKRQYETMATFNASVYRYSGLVVTGYLKRTTVDNKVVSFEYIPLD